MSARALPASVFVACLAAAVAGGSGARAGEIEAQVQQFALAAAAGAGTRVEVEVGTLDPRLRLAPCSRVEPYVPTGTRLWGRCRIGLRCAEGPTRWNVYLPLIVRVYGEALTASRALAAGAVLTDADLKPAQVDLAEGALPLRGVELARGRTLSRPLEVGQPLRHADLRARQWFSGGDTVQIVAVGNGFRITSEGHALGPGLEGQPARVRLEGGRIVSGLPVGERIVELRL